jgi:hypothetical protein
MEGDKVTPASITGHCARCFAVAPPVRKRVFTRWLFKPEEEEEEEEEERERARKLAWREDAEQYDDE